MAETLTQETVAPAAPVAPEQAPSAPAAKPMSARDYSRAMGLGGSDSSVLLGAANAQTEPVSPAPSVVPQGEAGKVDERGRAHGAPGTEKAGQYLAGQPGSENVQPAAAEGSGVEPSATPEGSQAEGTATTAASAVPDGYVRIEIPESLQRNFGREQIVPKGQEEFFRFNLKNHVRSAEVETLKRQVKETETLRQQLDTERAERLRVTSSGDADQKFRQTDEYRQFTEDFKHIREAEEEGRVPEGAASRYWQNAVQTAFKAFAEQEYRTQTDAVLAQAHDQAGVAWADEAWSRTTNLPVQVTGHPEFRRLFEETVYQLNYGLENGHYPEVTDGDAAHGMFRRLLAARLVGLPEVSQAMQEVDRSKREANAQTAKAQADATTAKALVNAERVAAANRKKEAELAALNAATNPLGNVSPGRVIRDARGAVAPMNAKNFDRLMSRR